MAAFVRPATLRDVERICALINLNRDNLVPRSIGSVAEHIDRFIVAEAEGEMAGCASYRIYPEIGQSEEATVEIVSVAVKSVFRRRGIGRSLIGAVLERIRYFGPKEAVVLTLATDFFKSLGFVEIPKAKILYKIYTGCINCTKHAYPFTCPEVAMAIALK